MLDKHGNRNGVKVILSLSILSSFNNVWKVQKLEIPKDIVK